MLKITLVLLTILGLQTAQAQDSLLEEKKLAQEYLEKMSKEENATVIEQGVVLRSVFKNTEGMMPALTDTVSVMYQGFDREGKDFDSSFAEDSVVEFPLNKLINCWQIAITKMTVGSYSKITCPSDTAYGDKGIDGVIKPGAALTFRVMLLATKPALSIGK